MSSMVRACIVVLAVLSLPRPALAQERDGSSPQEAWGSGVTRVTIPALALTPLRSTTAYSDFLVSRVCDAGSCSFTAPVQLPSGALLQRVDIEGCDNSTNENIAFQFYGCELFPNGGCLGLAELATGTAQTPGCGEFGVSAAGTVDNAATTYVLVATINGTGNDVLIRAVRVSYKLQVSAPPPTATFGDVPPQHGFFRFVEALAASGITGGCGGGNYCPDDPLTRGQMAVFLATALGLHWPN